MTGMTENSDNSDGSGRNSADWEIEWTKGMNGEETVLAMVTLGMGVTAESLWYEGNCLYFSFFLLGLNTGFLYYDMSTPQGHSLYVFTKGMRGWA
jgi:hypothetical protein